MLHVQEPTEEDVPLDYESSNDHIEPNTREPIALEERHEEAEPNEDHHVDVLEHCNERKKNLGQKLVWLGIF